MKSLPMVERLKKEIDENHFDINLVSFNIPLENGKRAIAEDLLEKNVDQKYYLEKKYIQRLILHPNFKKNYARIIVDRFTGEEKQASRVGGVYDTEKTHNIGSTYTADGVINTITCKSDRALLLEVENVISLL